MATTPITLNIDTTLITEAVNALCSQGGYRAFLADGITPNPITKAAFAKQVIRDFIRQAVAEQRTITAQASIVTVDPALIS